VLRLLSQAVSEEVCRNIKNLVDAQSKTRKMVHAATVMLQEFVYFYKLMYVSGVVFFF